MNGKNHQEKRKAMVDGKNHQGKRRAMGDGKNPLTRIDLPSTLLVFIIPYVLQGDCVRFV